MHFSECTSVAKKKKKEKVLCVQTNSPSSLCNDPYFRILCRVEKVFLKRELKILKVTYRNTEYTTARIFENWDGHVMERTDVTLSSLDTSISGHMVPQMQMSHQSDAIRQCPLGFLIHESTDSIYFLFILYSQPSPHIH